MTKREILQRIKAGVFVAAGSDPPTDRVDSVMLHKLVIDLAADVRAEEAPRGAEDVKPDPRQPGPVPMPPPPGPTSVSVTVPDGFRVVVERVNGKKRDCH